MLAGTLRFDGSVREYSIQVASNPLRLVFRRLVRLVADAVQGARRVRIESSEERVEVVLRRAGVCDEFEGLAKGLIRCEAVDQDLSDLTSRNHAIAGVPGLACIALQEDKLVLV